MSSLISHALHCEREYHCQEKDGLDESIHRQLLSWQSVSCFGLRILDKHHWTACNYPSSPPNSMAHLLWFSKAFGAALWVTFSGGIIMTFRNQRRHQFGNLQSKMFPVLFFNSWLFASFPPIHCMASVPSFFSSSLRSLTQIAEQAISHLSGRAASAERTTSLWRISITNWELDIRHGKAWGITYKGSEFHFRFLQLKFWLLREPRR